MDGRITKCREQSMGIYFAKYYGGGGGGKNGCWGKKMKTEGVGKKNEKEGEREKGEKRLKNGLKTHL